MLSFVPSRKNRGTRETRRRRAPAGDAGARTEIERCEASFRYFTDTYGVIDDSQGHGGHTGTMPFRLWPDQGTLADTLQAEDRVIILKARQLGISWLCCALALWTALFRPGQVVLLFSIGEEESKELLRRIKALYERLPPWLRLALPGVRRDNTTEFGFANGSIVRSLPQTQRAGRGYTASLVIADELAHMQWASQLYVAMKPTVDGGGRLVMLSTADGMGNLFHSLWLKAAAKLNNFTACFLPWWSRPGRDKAWYDRQVAEAEDPALIPQEYPSNPNEAFIASGRVRFHPDWIIRQAPNVRHAGRPRDQWPKHLQAIDDIRRGQSLHCYEPPRKGRRYIIGADVAEGLEHGDYDAAIVLDRATREEVCSLHGHWEPDEFADRLRIMAEAYGAPIVLERNNHGHAVLTAAKKGGFLGYFVHGLDDRRGWVTDKKTKPQSIDQLAQALRDGTMILHSQPLLDELQIYRIDDDGKTSAPEGFHDDRVMALAIVNCYLNLRGIRSGRSATAGGFKQLQGLGGDADQ
jgi:hypothetical protein